MQFLAQVIVLLFSRAPQRAISLLATPHIGSSGESSEQLLDLEHVQGSSRESWPWGKTPSTSTLPSWAESGQLQTTQPAVEDNSGAAAGWAVVSRGLQPWTPEWSELNELDRMLKQADQEMPLESEQPPATQAEQELFEARRAQVQAQWVRDKLLVEVKAKRRELSEFIEAERSMKQAAKQQELKKANETQQTAAQAAEQAARDAQDLQAAEAEAAKQVLVAQAAQERMQEFQAQVDARQREAKNITAKAKDLEAELKLKQYELKGVIEALPAKLQAAEQAALGVKSLQAAGAQAAEQVRAAQEKAKADANKHEQELMERRQKLEAQVDAKKRELKEDNETELADEQAAEQAARDVQRLQQAQAQAAEQARAAQAEAEAEAKQRELKVLENEHHFEAEMESKRRELKQATEALLATEATRALHFKEAAEALLAKPQAAEQVLAPQAVDTPKDPTQPGCYVRVPSGCPRLRVRSEEWRKDSWAEQQGLDIERCHRRKGVWDKYCGSTDTEMTFVANTTRSD